MADQDDEDFFSDGDMDESTLQAIENNALVSTQQRVAAQRTRQFDQARAPYRLSVPPTARQKSSITRPSAPPIYQPHAKQDVNPPSSDYGDDEDVMNLDAVDGMDAATQSPSRRTNPAFHPPNTELPGLADAIGPNGPTDLDMNYQDPCLSVQHPAPHAQDDARIKELERELAMHQQSAQQAETALLKNAGEIAIIRAKLEKDTREFERKISLLEKKHADDTAKHRAEVQAARKDRETVETNNRFLEHDLAQEVERTKRLKGPAKEAVSLPGRSKQSPAKPAFSGHPYRDGFDDHDFRLVSPSRPKPETPKVGGKRKRNVNPSPIRPLVLETVASTTSSSFAQPDGQPDFVDGTVIHQQFDKASHEFQTIQKILNHRPMVGCDRTLETLTKYAFPSMPEKSVAGTFIDLLSQYSFARDEPDLPLYVCNSILDIWSRCIEETYHTPLPVLADLLEFVSAFSPQSASSPLIQRFVPLATKSIDIVAVPIARPSEKSSNLEKTNSKIASTAVEEVDVDHILSMTHSMAMIASASADTNRTFWQEMEFDFLLMMLNVPQQLPHIQLVLQMVGASVLADSFGVISRQPEKQTTLEMHTIDRLTNLLFEKPRAPSDEPPYEDVELAALNIETVRTLNAIAITKRGSSALAQNRTAVGRLFRFLHIQVTALYDLPPSSFVIVGGKPTLEPSAIHKSATALINMTIRLLYHLLHDHADLINIREKLAVIPGGPHKFLVALTRLAFSEELVLEAGLDEEAVDAAHEILDLVLTPEEGDAIIEAIETPRGSTATRASAPR